MKILGEQTAQRESGRGVAWPAGGGLLGRG